MRFAYADPPYLGNCGRYEHYHPDGRCWDDPETHRLLVEQLISDRFDGWALSMGSPHLRTILPMCPSTARVAAWVKPWAVFHPGVNPAYAWEPVLFVPLRNPGRDVPTVRDWIAEGITMQTGTIGAKPEGFCCWLFDLIGLDPADDFVDLFTGSGAVGRAWEAWSRQLRLAI